MRFVLFAILLFLATADDWLMGGLDYSNTRSQEDDTITKDNVANLTVKWFRRTGLFTLNQPTGVDDWLYVGEFAGGAFYGLNATTGSTVWVKNLIGPVTGGAFIDGSNLFVATIAGFSYKLDRFTGVIVWMRYMGSPVWSSPLKIGDQVIFGLNPGEESSVTLQYLQTSCCHTSGSVVSLNETDGTVLWTRSLLPPASFINVTLPLPNIFGGLNSSTTFPYGPSGAAMWGDFSYSQQTGYIYLATGQAYSPDASGGIPSGVDSIFALRLDGTIAWQRSVRELRDNDINDVWISPLYWDPSNPTDMDIGNGPMLYKITGLDKGSGSTRTVVATGDKRGIWYVLDAYDGTPLNGQGNVALGTYPGPSASGGFNLQSCGAKVKGRWRSFGNLAATYSTQICSNVGSFPTECVKFDYAGNLTSSIVAFNADGTEIVDRFTRNNTLFFGSLVCINNEMVAVRDSFHKSVLFLDANNLNNVLREVNLSSYLSGRDYGGNMALINGQLYVPTGLYGSFTMNGWIAIGLPSL